MAFKYPTGRYFLLLFIGPKVSSYFPWHFTVSLWMLLCLCVCLSLCLSLFPHFKYSSLEKGVECLAFLERRSFLIINKRLRTPTVWRFLRSDIRKAMIATVLEKTQRQEEGNKVVIGGCAIAPSITSAEFGAAACVMWCSVALGCLVEGSPTESVREERSRHYYRQ